jgi:N-carbamoylputrescine amidase
MSAFTIALLQISPIPDDPAANLIKGERFCRQAAEQGADLALFPEMWNIGYEFFDPSQPGAHLAWRERAVGLDDPLLTHFRSLARQLDLAIALTFLERYDPKPRNTLALIDRHGEIVLVYAKLHTCEFDIEAELTPGETFPVATLDSAAGPVQIGGMICYDREFPESARILMLNGAEIILVPNACEIEANRWCQLHSRASENMVGVALANYPAPKEPGRSVAFDGIAFDPDGKTRSMTLVEAGEAEGVYLARFDLDALREYRRREGWGNAFRRPRRYQALIDETVREPFIRESATR